MKDIVLQEFVSNFAEEAGLVGLDDSSVFEAFAVSSILRKFQTIECELKRFGGPSGEHPSRLRAFTMQLIDAAGAPESSRESSGSDPLLGSAESGSIQWYDDWKNFGFIERDGGGDIIGHRSGITAVPWHLRQPGTRVTYIVAQGPTTLKADNVRLEGT